MTSKYDRRTPDVSLTPGNALFIVVSFEGPDPYSQAGGLGVRISGLVDALADLDYETHLFFIGDPAAPGEERRHGGRLILHRWAQWISANCPGGVYDGETAKVADLTASLPPYLADRLIGPAVAAGRIPVLLFEEWQTADAACVLSERLRPSGLRDRVVMAWNANNPYGFERIDWPRLAHAAMITTISRHMRSIVRACGADARVVPNGIPEASLKPVAKNDVARVHAALDDRRRAGGFLFKMARWEREKGWTQALDAIKRTREAPRNETPAEDSEGGETKTPGPVLIGRSGGPTGLGAGLTQEAQARGLRVVAFESESAFNTGLAGGIRAGADVVSLRFGVSPSLARTLYAASDGVLANSVSEPFGLVGLEAMAAGGIAFTGGTGEDYANAGRNAVVLETLDPDEIVTRWSEVASSPELSHRLRRAARKTARQYTWSGIVSILAETLTHQARRQGLVSVPATAHHGVLGDDARAERLRWDPAAIRGTAAAADDAPPSSLLTGAARQQPPRPLLQVLERSAS